MQRWVCLVCLLSVPCLSLPQPLPQPLPSPQDYSDNSDYGDYDESVNDIPDAPNNGLGDFLEFGMGLTQGFFALMSDQEVQDAVHSTIRGGLNLTGEVTRAAIPVAQGVIGVVPTLVTQGSRLAGSIIRAANDTAPLILEGLNEFNEQLPLIAGFATAYAEVNAEQTQKVVETFSKSLSCSLQCEEMRAGSKEREECEKKFCKKESEEEDDYDEFSI